MGNFDELDETVIPSSGRNNRKIKVETFSQSLAKAAPYNGEGKAPCISCNHIHADCGHNYNNKVCQAYTLSSEEIANIIQVFIFLFIVKHGMWSYLLLL